MRSALYAAVLALILSLSAWAGSVTMHRPVSTIYDLYLGGIKAGELTIDARFSGDRYSATSVMRTAGIVGALYKASFEAETSGRQGTGGLEPERFSATAQMYSDRQRVEMTYRGTAIGTAPESVWADPAFVPKPWQIEPADQAGTLDPVSAALAALAPSPVAEICGRSVEIYDGRRRYALDLGKPKADGERISCPALYRRVAGYKAKELKETIAFTLWFEERPDGLAHLVRAAGDSVLGLAVVLLRE
jgi:hypothetical protein